MCVGTRGWTLKDCIKPYKNDNNMVKPMNFNFWPDEVMESHKVLHIGIISTPYVSKKGPPPSLLTPTTRKCEMS
jgi:hypothetical protein